MGVKVLKKVFSIVLAVCMTTLLVVNTPFLSIEAEAAIKVYSQTDSRWANHSYGKGPNGSAATISSSGCGVLAYVNAVYYMTGKFIQPTTLADWSVKNGYRINGVGTSLGLYSAYASAYGAQYGFKYAGTATSVAKTKSHLQNGGVAIISVPNHLMALVDYNSSTGKYLILDSYKSSNRGTYSTGYRWLSASEFTGKLAVSAIRLISPLDTKAPTISNVKVTNITSSGYTVSCTVKDNTGVDRVQFPTWTVKNGQDDIQSSWGTNSAASGTKSGNTYTYKVKISDHNNERGEYTTHIYAYDKYGNSAGYPIVDIIVPIDVTKVALNKSKITFQKLGQSVTLTATVSPSNATDKSVKWSTSNEKVATVKNGVVKAVGYGTAKITAKASNGKYAVCQVVVNEPTLKSITVASKPSKTTYFVGEKLDVEGLKLKLEYSDATTKTVTSGFTTSGFDSSTVGTKTVTVSYGGKETTFTVTVKSKSPTSITVMSKPTKTNYFIGDKVDLSGLVVQANYDDGTTSNVTDYDTNIDDKLTQSVGNKTINISYKFNEVVKTTTFDISVTAPKMILSKTSVVLEEGDTTTLTVATTPSGQKVEWQSSNTAVATVSEGKITAISSGTATVSASSIYNGIEYKAVGTVTVIEKPVYLDSISIKEMPKKTSYEVGEQFDSTGLTVELSYTNGTSETLASGFSISGFDSATAGTKQVTVSYGGKKTSFSVVVNNKENSEVNNPNEPQFVVESKSVCSGEVFTVQISMKNNPGIIGLKINVDYDADVLELQNAVAKDLSKVFFGPIENIPFSMSWSDAIHGNMSNDVVLAELQFKVKDNVEVTSTPISVSYDVEDVFNSEWENVAFEVVNGEITLDKYVSGDVNGDGTVNMKDYALYQQYLNGWDVEIITQAADVNADGRRNVKDIALIQQYLNDWEVTLK